MTCIARENDAYTPGIRCIIPPVPEINKKSQKKDTENEAKRSAVYFILPRFFLLCVCVYVRAGVCVCGTVPKSRMCTKPLRAQIES